MLSMLRVGRDPAQLAGLPSGQGLCGLMDKSFISTTSPQKLHPTDGAAPVWI